MLTNTHTHVCDYIIMTIEFSTSSVNVMCLCACGIFCDFVCSLLFQIHKVFFLYYYVDNNENKRCVLHVWHTAAKASEQKCGTTKLHKQQLYDKQYNTSHANSHTFKCTATTLSWASEWILSFRMIWFIIYFNNWMYLW